MLIFFSNLIVTLRQALNYFKIVRKFCNLVKIVFGIPFEILLIYEMYVNLMVWFTLMHVLLQIFDLILIAVLRPKPNMIDYYSILRWNPSWSRGMWLIPGNLKWFRKPAKAAAAAGCQSHSSGPSRGRRRRYSLHTGPTFSLSLSLSLRVEGKYAIKVYCLTITMNGSSYQHP